MPYAPIALSRIFISRSPETIGVRVKDEGTREHDRLVEEVAHDPAGTPVVPPVSYREST